MFKKVLSVLVAVVLTVIAVTALPVSSSAREIEGADLGAYVDYVLTGTSRTQAEAVAWIAARKNEHWAENYDGSAYAVPQCVDLIVYYFDYLEGYHLSGNGYNYVGRTDLPKGWYYTSSPSAGDIAVWDINKGIARGNGHVALVESVSGNNFNYVDVNGATGTAGSGNLNISNPSSFIHPNFGGDTANIGDSFYAFIINTSMWKHLTVDQNLNVSIRSEKSHYCADQVFKFERQSDGSYKIISTANGYCLDVSNASTEAGANVGVYTGNDTDAQRWYLIGNSGDYYIKSKCSECVLDIYSGHSDEGTNVQMYTENGTAAQKFQVYKIEDRPFASDIGTQFTAPILNTKSWITLENDEDNNLSLQKETGMSRQLWQFKKQKDGSYKIYSCYDGKCIDLYWAYHEDGTNISQCNENSNDAQRWYFYSTNGGYAIQSKESGKVFDVYSGHFEYGTNIQAWTWNDTDSQKFTVYKGDECKLSSPALTIEAGTSTTDTVFRWNNVYGESGYNLKIWKDKIGEGEADILVNDADIETKLTLPAGTYQAVVEAYHFYESKKSNTVTFTVVQGEDPINPEVSILGDSDGDGTVTIVDATAIQRYLAQYPVSNEEALLRCGDVNGGGLDIMDATAIQRYLAHYDDPYHIGEPIK